MPTSVRGFFHLMVLLRLYFYFLSKNQTAEPEKKYFACYSFVSVLGCKIKQTYQRGRALLGSHFDRLTFVNTSLDFVHYHRI